MILLIIIDFLKNIVGVAVEYHFFEIVAKVMLQENAENSMSHDYFKFVSAY